MANDGTSARLPSPPAPLRRVVPSEGPDHAGPGGGKAGGGTGDQLGGEGVGLEEMRRAAAQLSDLLDRLVGGGRLLDRRLLGELVAFLEGDGRRAAEAYEALVLAAVRR